VAKSYLYYIYSPSRPAAHSLWRHFIFDALQYILGVKPDIIERHSCSHV